MALWLVKELSKLTGVSVQTLHHYDRIDLLKPSSRQNNGYRVYSEKDLLQLQQIIALKFFGFELSQIKALLTDKNGALKHFSVQASLLEQKAKVLLEASQALQGVISELTDSKSIPWETIIELVEVYRMTEQLDHAWVKEIFTPKELKQYLVFQTGLKAQSMTQKVEFEKNWAQLLKKIELNLDQDPKSAIGIALGRICMELVNGLYGKKFAHIRTKIFEEGFGNGKGLAEVGLRPESVDWLDKAVEAYWRDRIYTILDQVGKISTTTVQKLWTEVLEDMYGDDVERQQAIYGLALQDPKVGSEARAWLKNMQ